MAHTTTASGQAVFRVRVVFPETGDTLRKHVEASSRQRAMLWAREQHPNWTVDDAHKVDPAGLDDDEIVDVGGWDV